MPVSREFLGWDRAVLPAAAAWLLEQFGNDLSGLIIGVPTRRAGRRLLELLAETSGADASATAGLVPPSIQTPGSLPECFYQPQASPRGGGCAADDVEEDDEDPGLDAVAADGEASAGEWSAWVTRAASLKSADRATLEQVVPHPPVADDAAGWMRLAEQLGSVSIELAAGRLTPAGVVSLARQRQIDLGLSEARWSALAALEAHYQEALARDDRQAARLRALQQRACRCERTVVLVGLVDQNPQLAAMLQQVAAAASDNDVASDHRESVIALIPAPAEHAAGFGDTGGLLSDYWSQQAAPLESGVVEFVDQPMDQALALVRALGRLPTQTAAEDVSVGLGDEAGGEAVARTLELAGTPARLAAGSPLRRSGPVVLLETLAAFAATRSLSDLAALVRHPDLAQWLDHSPPPPPEAKAVPPEGKAPPPEADASQADADQADAVDGDPPQGDDDAARRGAAGWPALLDRYAATFLQTQVGGEFDASADWEGDGRLRLRIDRLTRRLTQLLPPGADPGGDPGAEGERGEGNRGGLRLPWPDWAEPIAELLGRVYGRRELSRATDFDLVEQLELIGRALRELAGLEVDEAHVPRVSFADAVGLLIHRLSRDRVPAAPARVGKEVRGAVEFVGYLEMPWDDAPHAVLTDLNEGHIPDGRMGDPFLPDSLRSALGLPDGRHRLGRDLFYLNVIVRTRASVKVLACRASSDGDPRVPSRLLLVGDEAIRAARLKRFYLKDSEHAPPAPPSPPRCCWCPAPSAASSSPRRWSAPPPSPASRSPRFAATSPAPTASTSSTSKNSTPSTTATSS